MRDNVPSSIFFFLYVENISLVPFFCNIFFDNFVYKLEIFEGLESVECSGTSDSMDPLGKHFPSQIQH